MGGFIWITQLLAVDYDTFLLLRTSSVIPMWWSFASLFHLNGDRWGTNTVGPCSGQMVCLPSSCLMLLLSSLFPKKNPKKQTEKPKTHTQTKQTKHTAPPQKTPNTTNQKIQPTPRRKMLYLIFWTFPLQPLWAVKGSWSMPDLWGLGKNVWARGLDGCCKNLFNLSVVYICPLRAPRTSEMLFVILTVLRRNCCIFFSWLNHGFRDKSFPFYQIFNMNLKLWPKELNL